MIDNIRSWPYGGFNVDRTVYLEAGGPRSPLAARGAMSFQREPCRAAHGRGQGPLPLGEVRAARFPEPGREDLAAGASQNFQVFEPRDFIAELTKRIPNKGEHLVRSYG